MLPKENFLIVILPALNEETNILATINQIPTKLTGMSKIEVVVVNDGSTDHTESIAKNAGATVLSHTSNKGITSALRTGIDYALSKQATLVVSLDADNQFDPKEITNLLNPILKKKADMVIGNRFSQKNNNINKPNNMSTIKYLGNIFIAACLNIVLGTKFADVSSGFRAYNRKALMSLKLNARHDYTQESILDLIINGLTVISIPVSVRYFTDRKSRVASNLFKYGFYTAKTIIRTYRDYKPMCLFGLLSTPFFLIATLVGITLLPQFFGFPIPENHIVIRTWGLYSLLSGISLLLVGFVLDTLVHMRLNQDRITYLLNRILYEKE